MSYPAVPAYSGLRRLTKAAFLQFVVVGLLICAGCASVPSQGTDPADGEGNEATTETPAPTKQELIAAGDNAWRSGDAEKALFEYIRALELDDADKNLYLKIGLVHEYQGNYGLAEVAYNQCLQLDDTYIPAHERKGTVLLRQRRYSEAKLSFSRAIELDKARIASKSIAATQPVTDESGAGANEQPDNSMDADTEPTLDRQSPFYAYNGLGVIEDIHGDHHKALVAFNSARTINPNSAFVHNNMGYSCYMADDMEVAEMLFKKAVAIDPDYKVAWRNLALVHVRRGEYDEAISILTSKVENEAAAYNTVGYLSMLDGNHKIAEVFFNKAIELSPSYFKAANENLKKNRQLYSSKSQ